jgi:hypothetical protein
MKLKLYLIVASGYEINPEVSVYLTEKQRDEGLYEWVERERQGLIDGHCRTEKELPPLPSASDPTALFDYVNDYLKRGFTSYYLENVELEYQEHEIDITHSDILNQILDQ